MCHGACGFLCRVPVGIRLAAGFLFAGLAAALAVGFVGLLPAPVSVQAANFQDQLSAANAELTTALVLLQANDSSVHFAIEDAATGQPHSVLLSDQAAAQGLASQYEAEIATFVRENLLAQQPAREIRLIGPEQNEAVEQQRGLVISLTYAWQRYHAAQTLVLQDVLANQFTAAELLARFQADPMETDVLSALYGLIKFQGDLALTVQHAASMQAAQYHLIVALLGASAALLVILIAGLLVSFSVVGPLHRLRRVTQAVAAGERVARVVVVGQDEIADIALCVNDLLISIESLLAEVNRQHHGQVSAAELLFAGIRGGDVGAVRAQVAEAGDALRVLETICGKAIADFQAVASTAQATAQQIEAIAQRTHSQAEAALLDQQGAPIELAQEIMATTQQLEALARALAASLPGFRTSEAASL